MEDHLTPLILLILQCLLGIQVLASSHSHQNLHIRKVFEDPMTIFERGHIERRQNNEKPLLRISE
jgi:hypothetical protein